MSSEFEAAQNEALGLPADLPEKYAGKFRELVALLNETESGAVRSRRWVRELAWDVTREIKDPEIRVEAIR